MGAAAGGAPHHQPITRRTARSGSRSVDIQVSRRFPRVALGARRLAGARTPALDPLKQFSQQERSDAAQNDDKDEFPCERVHQLIELLVWHAKDYSNYAA